MAELHNQTIPSRGHQIRRLSILLIMIATSLVACKESAVNDEWTKNPNVTVTAMMSPEEGKNYINIIYENFSEDTITKLKYELLSHRGQKWDTTVKIIEPPVLFKPKDRHLVPRAIGEEPTTADEVAIGHVWVVKR